MPAPMMDLDRRSIWIRSTPSETERTLPFFCYEAGSFLVREPFAAERARTGSYLVLFTVAGAGRIEQGTQTCTLREGQALLMDGRDAYRIATERSQRRWHYLWAQVDGDGADALARLAGTPRIRKTDMDPDIAKAAFDEIFDSLEREGYVESLRISCAIDRLLTAVALAAVKSDAPASTDAVAAARAYIEEHSAEELKVDQVAQQASISTSQLIRLFKRHMGTTPHSYLLRCRISRAKKLLAETTMPVASIAREIGFASESNFSYRFSQMTGQSPSAYRAGTPRTGRDRTS